MTEEQKKTWERVFEVGGIIAGALGLKGYIASAVQKGIEPFIKPLTQDQRAELMADILRMPAGDKENLLRRIRAACANRTENRMMFLLSKIEKEGADGRRPILKLLNDLSDQDFEMHLEMMNHDVLKQWVLRVADRNGDGTISMEDLAELRRILNRIFSPIADAAAAAGRTARTVVRDIDDAATRATPAVARLTNLFRDLNEGGK